ncbi:MAG TPA: DUF427 domain-containing protein [Candidatus Acidoferrum sp.]|nr:DUF427 domain-containing protein [Candidatus Acidoferrum sp.]
MQEARLEARYQMWVAQGGRVRLEPTERRVRAVVGGIPIADSKRAQLLFLPPPFNAYVFPRDDVRWDLLSESGAPVAMPGLGDVARWGVSLGGIVRENAVWTFPHPPQGLEQLAELVLLRWHLMDAWYEEDDEVFVHPRDPYHRVDVVNSSRHVKVTVGGVVLAETGRPRLLFETGLPVRYYIPKLDVRMEMLEPSQTISRCPYKGMASYWSVRAAGAEYPDLAWSYKSPIPECPKIENLIAFFNERVDLDVDGERLERPRTPWSVASKNESLKDLDSGDPKPDTGTR